MQLSVKLIMNSLYGEQIPRDIEESYQCKSEMRMMTDYDESSRLSKNQLWKLYRENER